MSDLIEDSPLVADVQPHYQTLEDSNSTTEQEAINEAGSKYAEFMEALGDYHDKTDALMRTIDNEAEPAIVEYLLAALFFWCYPFFRRWLDGHTPGDPSQLEYYQRAFHTYKSSDLDLNTFSALPLNYCKSFFQQLCKILLGFGVQLTLLVAVSLSLFTDSTIWKDIGDVPQRVLAVAAASSLLLVFLIRDQFRGTLVSARFFAWYPEIYWKYWPMFLLEAWSNFGISLFLFYLNLVVVLQSDKVEDAVLNSVAIFFIAQIDELLVPDYRSDDSKDHAFAVELFRHYCENNFESGVHFSQVEDQLASTHRYWCRFRLPFLKRK